MTSEIKECLRVLEEIKDEIRGTIKDLDEESLNWRPLSSEVTNSIFSLVVHLCGSEKQMIHHTIGRLKIKREREAEFRAKGESVNELETLMKDTSETSREILESLTSKQLEELRDTGLWGEVTVRRAILRQIHHQALHLGQIQITRQLYEASPK
jgi:uncharacterized damage-inducible protein DinB